MKNFFIGKLFMGDVRECVMVDNDDRGVLHFLSTHKELKHYTQLNGGKIHLKSDYGDKEVQETFKSRAGFM